MLIDFIRARLDELEPCDGGTAACDHLSEWALAQSEATRSIIDRVEGMSAALTAAGQPVPQVVGDAIDGMLLDLAQPYADHPEFRQEWRED